MMSTEKQKPSGQDLQRQIAELLGWTELKFTGVPLRWYGKHPDAPIRRAALEKVPEWHFSIDLCMRDLVPPFSSLKSERFDCAMCSLMGFEPAQAYHSIWSIWAHAAIGQVRPIILMAAFINTTTDDVKIHVPRLLL